MDEDTKEIKRQKRELAEGRRIQWTDITDSISAPVQATVELEPTYKEIETNTDTLALYLLLETVCNRSALDNSETYRTQLVEHTYVAGECIFSWFVIFDELVKNINRTGSNSSRIRICAHAHKAEYCFFDPEGDYCYPDVKDAHLADIANGGPGIHVNRGTTPRNNTKPNNKAYNTTLNEEVLREDASMDGNYMVQSGRINAVTYCAGDEEEVDYSESPVPSVHDSPSASEQSQTPVPDTDPVEQEEGEVMEVESNTPANNMAETSPDDTAVPAHLINIDGVGYTVAQLAIIVAA
ncbi:hypothetical protein B484DRAFT_406204 [Ochromonadaceae sp. CCMP2298]|nr:hypothetical protein B484DRAFT_406204 [Ochromonadaceae sp. CCMP2298]